MVLNHIAAKLWSLENAVANAVRYIKLRLFRSVLTDVTDRIKKWKRHALSTQNDLATTTKKAK